MPGPGLAALPAGWQQRAAPPAMVARVAVVSHEVVKVPGTTFSGPTTATLFLVHVAPATNRAPGEKAEPAAARQVMEDEAPSCYTVRRRFKDFLWLQTCLIKSFPDVSAVAPE